MEKQKVKPRRPDNEDEDVKDILSDLREAIQEISNRQDEVEDRMGEVGREDGRHKVILAKQFYQADKKGILEVTRISKLASRPLSLALALGDYLGKDIQSGKMSLPRIRLDYFFRLQLSGGGWNRAMSIPVLQEQVSVEGREEEGLASELEAGGK